MCLIMLVRGAMFKCPFLSNGNLHFGHLTKIDKNGHLIAKVFSFFLNEFVIK